MPQVNQAVKKPVSGRTRAPKIDGTSGNFKLFKKRNINKLVSIGVNMISKTQAILNGRIKKRILNSWNGAD